MTDGGWLFLNIDSWEYGTEVGANATTDGVGRFTIPQKILPIGETYWISPGDPYESIQMEVLSTIDLRASTKTDQATLSIDLCDMDQDLDVVLQL